MSKPKNMTPEQEAAWKAKQAARRATPEYKAKAAIRGRKYYDANKDEVISRTAARRETELGAAARIQEGLRRRASADAVQVDRDRQRRWQATAGGREKNLEKVRRYQAANKEAIKDRRRLKAHFERFMARLLAGEDVYGIGDAG